MAEAGNQGKSQETIFRIPNIGIEVFMISVFQSIRFSILNFFSGRNRRGKNTVITSDGNGQSKISKSVNLITIKDQKIDKIEEKCIDEQVEIIESPNGNSNTIAQVGKSNSTVVTTTITTTAQHSNGTDV